MRRIIWLVTCVFASVMTIGSGSPSEHNSEVATVGIEGAWRLSKSELNGQQLETLLILVTYCDGLFSFEYSDGTELHGSYRIDPSLNPPHLDLVPSNGMFKGRTLGRIYQVDGNKLVIAVRFKDGFQQAVKNSYSVDTYTRLR